MNIIISKHAAEQAEKRGIAEEGMKAIVCGAVFNVKIRSARDPSAFIVIGMYNDKIWSVIFNRYTDTVITVRRAQPKEERLYYDKRRLDDDDG